MGTFDIGSVPIGWKRGERLDIRFTPNEPETCVIIYKDNSDISYSDEPVYDGIAAIFAYKGDEEKVRAWLKWWDGKDA